MIRSLLLISAAALSVDSWSSTGKTILEPPLVKALAVAYAHFEGELSQDARTTDFQSFAANIENYQIRLHAEENELVVEFSLRPYQGGGLIRGGSRKYEIDRRGERILNIERYR